MKNPYAVLAFIHNRVFGTDTLFIRTKSTVGAQSAQCPLVPHDGIQDAVIAWRLESHLTPRNDARAYYAYAVPPTVKPSMRKVGCPTPTGTLWPSLPQVPTPVSRRMSLPIMLTRFNTSGPLPMSVAPLTG